jgi:hypothetical protein
MVAGHPARTYDLVSLRNFMREALDLAPTPSNLTIPQQGPARPSASGARSKTHCGNETSKGGIGDVGMGGDGAGGLGTDAPSEDPSASGHVTSR